MTKMHCIVLLLVTGLKCSYGKFPARLPRSRLEKPRSRQPSQPALSYEDVEIFLKDQGMCRDLRDRASPVNRAHMKRPWVDLRKGANRNLQGFEQNHRKCLRARQPQRSNRSHPVVETRGEKEEDNIKFISPRHRVISSIYNLFLQFQCTESLYQGTCMPAYTYCWALF